MKCTSKEQESCNVEKLGCTGCYYNEKTINICEGCKVVEGAKEILTKAEIMDYYGLIDVITDLEKLLGVEE